MKSFLRWSAALSLTGGILLATCLAGAQRVLALTDAEIVELLRPVPVFTITDAEGAPLVAASSQQGQEGAAVAGVFINQVDAQNFLNNLRRDNPQLAEDVQVVPVSLAEVYELARQSEQQEGDLSFSFVPAQQQVESALALLQQNGQDVQQFEGVPLFVVESTTQEGGYPTIQQGDQEVLPMFFNREELQAMLDRLIQQQPDLSSQVSVGVINLQGVIDTLQTSDDPELNRIRIVPPRETLEYLQSIQPEPGQAAPATP